MADVNTNTDTDEFSSGSELDEEEEAGKIQTVLKKGRRRSNMCTDSLNVSNLKDYVKPVFEKDDDTKAMLKDSISNSQTLQVLVGHLPEVAINDIINAFELVEPLKDEELIRQGDKGDCLYIIGRGEVNVFVKRPARNGDSSPQRGNKATTLGPGALFGELSLMYAAPRAATAIVTTDDTQLWRLNREPFKKLVISSAQEKYELYEGWLREIELLSVLNRFELARLSEAMTSELFDDGETIVQQGDIGDKFYILEDGICHAYIAKDDGTEVMVKEYATRGDYFGEIALLIDDQPRKASIRAGDDGAAVVSISKTDFTNLLGPLTGFLKEDIENYRSVDSY